MGCNCSRHQHKQKKLEGFLLRTTETIPKLLREPAKWACCLSQAGFLLAKYHNWIIHLFIIRELSASGFSSPRSQKWWKIEKKKIVWKAECKAPRSAPAKACVWDQRKFNCLCSLGNKHWQPQYHPVLPTVTVPATLVPLGLLLGHQGSTRGNNNLNPLNTGMLWLPLQVKHPGLSVSEGSSSGVLHAPS